MAAAENTAMLVVGRVMLGFGVGISCLVIPAIDPLCLVDCCQTP